MIHHVEIESLISIIIFGAILMTFLYHSIQYFYSGDRLIVYYLNYLFFAGFYTLYVSGVFRIFWGENIQKLFEDHLGESLQMIYFACYFFFIISIIAMNKKNNDKIIKKQNLILGYSAIGILVIYAVSIAIITLSNHTDYHEYISFFWVRVVIWILAVVLLYKYFKLRHLTFEKYILYGSIGFFMSTLLSTCFHYLDIQFIDAKEWLIIGSMVDIFFFSIAINYRVRKLFKNINENLLKTANEKIKVQMALIEKQNDLNNERTRIAEDMHDDIGSGLTKINYLSQMAQQAQSPKEKEDKIEKIKEISEELVGNMSEIIWAMKEENNDYIDFITYIKSYSYEYLTEHNINLTFHISDLDQEISLKGDVRRNVFLVIKECLHNIVKHSHSQNAEIHITYDETQNLLIQIIDDGIGFSDDILTKTKGGNGLKHIKKRMKSLGGNCSYDSKPGKTEFNFKIPLKKNHTNSV